MMPVVERGGARSVIRIAGESQAALLWLSIALCGCVAADAPQTVAVSTAKLDIVDGVIQCGELANGPELSFNVAAKSTDGEPVLIADLSNVGPQMAFSMKSGRTIEISGVDRSGIVGNDRPRYLHGDIQAQEAALWFAQMDEFACGYKMPEIHLEAGRRPLFGHNHNRSIFIMFREFPAGVNDYVNCWGSVDHYKVTVDDKAGLEFDRMKDGTRLFSRKAENDPILTVDVYFSPEGNTFWNEVKSDFNRKISFLNYCVSDNLKFYCSFDGRLPSSFVVLDPYKSLNCRLFDILLIDDRLRWDGVRVKKQTEIIGTSFQADELREFLHSFETLIISEGKK